ncbi:MAG TPA: tetratricopeptide repeat protein [Caulobacteraceae bacterium]
MQAPMFTRLAAGCVCAALLAGGAIAQTPLDDALDNHSAKRLDRIEKVVKELRAIVFQGRETGRPVVVQPADTDSQITSLTDKLNDLDHTLTRLNGQNEIIRHDLDEARHEALDLQGANDALKARVLVLEQSVQTLTNPPPPPPAAAIAEPPVSAASAFAQARTLLQSGDDAAAETALQAFVESYGDTAKGPEARYLLGGLLLRRQAWPEAATAEIGAIRGWPATIWASSAVIDLARALVGMNKNDDACQTLDELARRYPKASSQVTSTAAKLRSQARCG